MININNYVIEKLHLSKDTKMMPSQYKEGDNVLEIVLNPDGDDDYIMNLYYGYITEISRIGDGEFDICIMRHEWDRKKEKIKEIEITGMTMKENFYKNLELTTDLVNEVIIKDREANKFMSEIETNTLWKDIKFENYFDSIKKVNKVSCSIYPTYYEKLKKEFL